jgi:hypothetical protein
VRAVCGVVDPGGRGVVWFPCVWFLHCKKMAGCRDFLQIPLFGGDVKIPFLTSFVFYGFFDVLRKLARISLHLPNISPIQQYPARSQQ